MIDHDETERDETVKLAGALERKVQDVYEDNAGLRATNDSLETAFSAVAQENESLRTSLEHRTRQRDEALRRADLLEEQMRTVFSTSREALRAVRGNPDKQQETQPSVEFTGGRQETVGDARLQPVQPRPRLAASSKN